MSTLLVQSGTFDDIADAIRAKTGKVASMTPLEMPQEIASISGGGVTKKKNYVISQDINASSLREYVIDETDTINYVNASTYNSYANAFETDLIKMFYDVPGAYHQYYWHVIAKVPVTYNGTDYSAGDTVDYWYYNVQKNLIIEET